MSEQAERELQVRSQLKYLNNIIDTIEAQMTTLEARLQSVLTPPMPKTAEPEPIEDDLVPLAQEIADFRKRLIIISQQFDDIDERLEL